MRRREFIVLLAGSAAWPLAAHGQQPAKMPVIGYLDLGPASARKSTVQALRAGLYDLGYVEGKNIAIEFRSAERADQLFELATQFVRKNVDVIFAPSSTHVEAARRATKTIPIVFASHADPVGVGHVGSLSRPGGNVTGLSMLMTDLAVKELELLKEALPHAKRIGVLWNPTTPSHPPALKELEAAGAKLNVQLIMVPTLTTEDFSGAFSKLTQERVDGVLVFASPLTGSSRVLLAQIALEHRLPSIFSFKTNVLAGGLFSYGVDFEDQCRRAATYIDKILKGAKPADLPVEQGSRYELVINLKTAKSLGLTVPPTLLARADEIIE